VAILFGVLGMRCDEVIREYVRLGKLAFEERRVDGKAVVSPRGKHRLEFAQAVTRLVEERLGSDAKINDSGGRRTGCRVSFECGPLIT
jgi:hypothetical protein